MHPKLPRCEGVSCPLPEDLIQSSVRLSKRDTLTKIAVVGLMWNDTDLCCTEQRTLWSGGLFMALKSRSNFAVFAMCVCTPESLRSIAFFFFPGQLAAVVGSPSPVC